MCLFFKVGKIGHVCRSRGCGQKGEKLQIDGARSQRRAKRKETQCLAEGSTEGRNVHF